MHSDLSIRVLGPVTVERAGKPLDVGGPQARCVLAVLALRPGQGVSVAELAAVLWGDLPPPSFRAQVHNLISGLRRALPPELIVTQPPGYSLCTEQGRVDLVEFRGEVAAGRRHLAAGRHAPAAELFRTALARWSGRPCSDLSYQAIQEATIGLEEQYVTALEDRIDADLVLGRGAELISELLVLTRDHPLNERFRGQLMTAMIHAGRPADALAVYRECRRTMVEELGVEPSAKLQDLHQAVLTGTAVPSAGAGIAGGGAMRVVPRQAPAPVSDLVGRNGPLGQVIDLLLNGRTNVVLSGPGGVGKTALALRIADALRERFPDGQLYARLGGAGRDPVPAATVLARFLRALGVPPDEVPRDPEERAGLFRSMLAARRLLIILDDVADAAHLRPLLPAGRGCRLLATSRKRLDGMELLRSVPLDVLPAGPSVDLLRAVAGQARIDAEPGAATDIAGYCGGLPLALRIAGSRLAARGGWKVRDMARSLADARQRLDWLHLGDLDVRASVLGSYHCLPGDQQRLFRLLALVRTHEFPAWVAAALADSSRGAERAVDGLAEAHLVEPAGSGIAGPRYRMHDLVRLLADELAAGEDGAGERRAALRRAFDGWLALAAAADSRLPHWVGLDPEPAPRWRPPGHVLEAVRADPMAWLDEERTALVDVAREAADDSYARVAWPLAQRLSTYFDLRGLYGEWTAVLTGGLRAAEAAGDAQGRATMLGLLCNAAAAGDDYAASLAYGERVVAAYAALDGVGAADHPPPPDADPVRPGGADLVRPGGADLVRQGGADGVWPEGADTVRPGGADGVRPGGADLVRPGGADGVWPEGADTVRPDRACSDHPEVVACRDRLVAARRGGDPVAPAFAAARLAHAMRVAHVHGDYLGLFEEAREGFRAGEIPLLEAWALQYVGLIRCRRGRLTEAAECLARARAILAEYGDAAEMRNGGGDLGAFAAAHGRFDEAVEMAREGLAQARRVDDEWSMGKTLMTLGELAWTRGDHHAALRAYLDALAVWRKLNVPDRVDRVTYALRERFGLSADEPVAT